MKEMIEGLLDIVCERIDDEGLNAFDFIEDGFAAVFTDSREKDERIAFVLNVETGTSFMNERVLCISAMNDLYDAIIEEFVDVSDEDEDIETPDVYDDLNEFIKDMGDELTDFLKACEKELEEWQK